jgi:segregation and condensation protein B
MDTQELKRIVEALIFAADGPLSAERILETLEPQNGFELGAVIDELNREYQESGRAFTIRQIAGGYQIVTQANYAGWIKKLYLGRQKTRLSQAALETLALVAFKQPISRVEVAQIRGVNSDGVIGTLLERKLITISGRAEGVGRPLLYSTTPEFLKYFGLNDLSDLPRPREIEELFGKEGMPEELLHALSQEDSQLSLPINVEPEASSSPDEGENQATAAKPAEQPAAYQPPVAPNVVETPSESVTDEGAESTVPPEKPAEPSPVSETATEVVPIDINDEVVTLLDDFGAPAPPRGDDEPTPQTSSDENPITTIAVAGNLPVLPDRSAASDSSLEILSIIPPTRQTNREEILPETLAAGVHELYQEVPKPSHENTQVVEVSEVQEIYEIPVISSLASDEASSAPTLPFSPARDDHFATTSEIVLLENSAAAFNDDSESEVDGWLAEEFSREGIAEPDFLLKADERQLEDLRNIPKNSSKPSEAFEPTNIVKATDLNGAATDGSHHEPAALTVRMQSPILEEIFKEGKTNFSDSENDSTADNESTTDNALDSTSLALPEFPELNKIEMPPADASLEASPELLETTSTARAEEPAPSQSVSSAVVEISDLISLAPNEASAGTEALEMNGGLWATFRDKASGWIKRALVKLMAFVGKRPD